VSVVGRERLTGELRRLNRLSVGGLLEDQAAGRAAGALACVASDLTTPLGQKPWWWFDPAAESTGGWERFNPVAPPLELTFDGRAIRGTVEMGVEFTGPPDLVHGGFVATVLDHALGIYLSRIGRPSVTASLTIRYLAPTPLRVPLELEGTHSVIHGSLTEAWAELRHEGRTTARAEGRFRLVSRTASQENGSTG
jgi:acyl-coenzyme A thioesterase PaaI-like protein